MAAIRIRDTILDGNMGEGWADNYAAAQAFAAALESAYRNEFGDDADIRINVGRNVSGWTCVDADAETDRAGAIRDRAWELFCSDPPAELVA